MTSEKLLQSGKQRQSLLSQGREVASMAAKVQSALPTAKAPGDFLLDFEHTNIALGPRRSCTKASTASSCLCIRFSRLRAALCISAFEMSKVEMSFP